MVWKETDLFKNVGPVLFQNVAQDRSNVVIAFRYIDQILRSDVLPYSMFHPKHMFRKDNVHALNQANERLLHRNNVRTLP